METVFYTLSVAWKEIQLISKDRGGLALLFILPLLIGSLVGGINVQLNSGSEDGGILVNVSLANEDAGIFGERIADALLEIDALDVQVRDSAAEAEALVSAGDVAAAIVIPTGFSDDIDTHTPTEIEVIVDMAQIQSANIVTGIMNQVVDEVTIWGEVQYGVYTILAESGALEGAGPEVQMATGAQIMGVIMTQLNQMRHDPAIVVASENLEGATVEGGIILFLAYVFPGFSVMFVFFIVGMAGASILKERESGTLRRLVAAPISRGAIIAGKMIAYILLACLQVTVLFTVAKVAFDMPLGESPLGLVVVTVVVAFVATALGMLVAGIVKSAKQADDVGTILGFVLAGVGGALPMSAEPLSRAGGVVGVISNLTPHAHAVEAYYSLMAENAALIDVLPEIGTLLAMGLVFFAVALWRFRFQP
ncbi:MAG: ABC transporter permease [Anaerolineae bacterium]|nr:ABC transporter permease [Anaerolineae bacterium]